MQGQFNYWIPHGKFPWLPTALLHSLTCSSRPKELGYTVSNVSEFLRRMQRRRKQSAACVPGAGLPWRDYELAQVFGESPSHVLQKKNLNVFRIKKHHKHTNCSWLFISNHNNVSDILDWTQFLNYFWFQEFIQRQT